MSDYTPTTEDEREALAARLTGDILDAVPDDNDMQHVLELAASELRGPRPITDEMVAAADFAIMPYWGERYPSGSLTTEIARAALEAAEEARR